MANQEYKLRWYFEDCQTGELIDQKNQVFFNIEQDHINRLIKCSIDNNDFGDKVEMWTKEIGKDIASVVCSHIAKKICKR